MQSFSRYLLLPALVIVALLAQTGCQAEQDLTPQEYVASARSYQEKEKIPEAVIQLKNALRKDPGSVEGRLLLGRIYLDQGAAAAAEEQFRKAVGAGLAPEMAELGLARALSLQGQYQQMIESDVDLDMVPLEDRAELLALNGDAYLAIGQPNRAEEFYTASLSVEGENPYATVGKAGLFMARSDLAAARKQLLAALDANPDFAQAWRLLGMLALREGNLVEAEDSFTQAIQRGVASEDLVYSRALTRIRLQQFDEAKEDIQLLRQAGNRGPMADYAEGLLKFAQGDTAGAETRFSAVLGVMPDHAPALYWAGVSNTLLGNLVLAESQLQRHLSISPANVKARTLLAQLQLKGGDPAEAEKLALQVLQELPDDVASLVILADVSDQLGDRESAAAYSRRVLAARPESPVALARLSNALVNIGEADEGLRELQQAAELYPESADAAHTLVQQHLRRGDFDAALTAARDFTDSKPDDPNAFISLGLVHLARKERELAAAAFQRALAIEPGNTSANQGMALLAIRQQDYNTAEGYLLKALEYRQGDLQTLMNLANLKALQAEPEAQQKFLQQAIASNPAAVSPRLKLGRIQLASGDAAGAISTIDDVVPRQLGNRDLLGLLAEAQVADKRFSEAQATLTRLDKLAPEDARVQYYLALAYEGLQNFGMMGDALKKSAELDPDYLPARIGLANLAIREGDIATAESRLAELKAQAGGDNADTLLIEARLAELKLDWTGAEAAYRKLLDIRASGVILRLLAQAKWNAGDTAGALQEYEQWLKDYPKDSLARLELAQRLLDLGRIEQAIANYQIVSEAAPGNQLALNNLAALLAESQPEKALEYARRAHALSPDSPAVLDTLAAALLRTGDTQRATRMIKRALAKQPDNPSFLYRQAQILEAVGQPQMAVETLDQVLGSGREFTERAQAEAMLARLRAGS